MAAARPEREVAAAETAFAKTMADRDLAAFASHIAEDAIFSPGPNTLRGKAAIVAAYKASYMDARAAQPAPLYPGAEDLLRRLAARDDLLLAVATGKSRRGLRALLEHHGLEKIFVTCQVADDHPSKPSPSMVLAALSETGCHARQTVMIGDTSFDMEMGAAAGVATIGVSWGYHPVTELIGAGAGRIVDDFAALARGIDEQLELV